MRNIILILFFLVLSGCSLATMAINQDDGFNDPRWDNRSKKIELAKSLIGKHKDYVIKTFGNPNPKNVNNNRGKAPLIKGDPYEKWITSEEEWVYNYYEHGIPLINSVNYWISFHFINDHVVTIDY